MLQRADEHVCIISVETKVMRHFERPLELNIRKADRNLMI